MSGRHIVVFLGAMLVLTLGFVMVFVVMTKDSRAGAFPPLRPIELKALPNREHPAVDLLIQRCISCHALPDPRSHTARSWPAVLRRMSSYSAARLMPPLTEEESEILMQYLRVHAEK